MELINANRNSTLCARHSSGGISLTFVRLFAKSRNSRESVTASSKPALLTARELAIGTSAETGGTLVGECARSGSLTPH